MPGTYKETLDAAKKDAKKVDADTKKKVEEMSDEEKREALKKKIKQDSTSVQITTQG